MAQIGSWKFIVQGCVGAKNNQFKEIAYVGPSRFIGAIKLVHRSGYVSCRFSTVGSNWGCRARGTSLAMVVTDAKNRTIYPSPRLVTVSSGGSYTLPGYTSSSPKLILTDFGNPKYIITNEKLRIWYGEDLKGSTESDNNGTTCMDIYAYFIFI